MTSMSIATTAAGSGFEGQVNGVTHRVHASAPAAVDDSDNTTATITNTAANGAADTTEELQRAFRRKYRHVEAVHSVSQPTCLSHDATEAPSFLGFRNLMVIVLGKAPSYFCSVAHGLC